MSDRRNAAVYGALSGGRSARSEPRGLLRALNAVVAQAGSVAGAARELDIPRRTLRRWLTGENKPNAARIAQVEARASLITRRARMTPARETRLRRAKTITIRAVYNYDEWHEGKRREKGKARHDNHRDVKFTVGSKGSTGLAAGTPGRLVDAFYRGVSGEDPGPGLFNILVANMSDGWYQAHFGMDANEQEGWTVEKVTLR